MAMYWAEKVLLIKSEVTYGVDPAPSAAANAILATDITLSPMEGQDVSRELERTFMGAQSTIPAGLHAKISFKVELKGSGTAGTPPASAPILLACAFAQVIGEDEVTYTRISKNHGSAAIYINIGGILYKMVGARGTGSVTVSAQGVVYIECELTGLFTQPADQVVPTANYGNQVTLFPEIATTQNTPVCRIGGVQMIANSLTLNFGNSVETRFWIGSDSVIISAISETLEMKVEAVPLATWNPYAIAASGAPQTFALTHGTDVGNIVDITAGALQIQRPATIGQTQGIVDWTIRSVPLPVNGNDQISLTFR